MTNFYCKSLVCRPVESDENATNIRYREDEVELYCNDGSMGSGLLIIKEENIVWWNESQQFGFEMDYPIIMCHAVCTDSTRFSKHCIFCHLDTDANGLEILKPIKNKEESDPNGETIDDDESSDDEIHELRFVPQNETTVQSIFEAISECQALHPDEDMDGPEGDNYLYTIDDINDYPDQARAQSVMNHLDSVFQMPSPDEFERIVSSNTSCPKEMEKMDEEIEEDQFADAD